jgi:hypothetical protein
MPIGDDKLLGELIGFSTQRVIGLSQENGEVKGKKRQ